MSDLETPADKTDIYSAIGEEISEHRPMFTGDIYEHDDSLRLIVQHPCAIRQGTHLNPKILVCPVAPNGNLRSNWSKCSYKIMPLPNLVDGKDYSADFVDLDLAPSSELHNSHRQAALSHYGVNLLLQRWLHHNSRVIVPTVTLSAATVGPFTEADLTEEWIDERADYGIEPLQAMVECSNWLDMRVSTVSRRDELSNPQHASRIRREARQHWKSLN